MSFAPEARVLLRRPIPYAPRARFNSERRHRRSAGHIFSVLAEKIWKKRPLERFYSAVAPESLTFGLFCLARFSSAANRDCQAETGKTRKSTHGFKADTFRFCRHKYLPQQDFRRQKFCGPPEGRSDYGRCNDKTQNGTTRFFCASALFASPASLFCILFSDKPEKSMSAKRSRTASVQNQSLLLTFAVISRILS